MKAWSRRVVLLLTVFVAVASVSAADTSADDSRVYGEPGEGRIVVKAAGGYAHWEHPGVYWLPEGATLLDLVKLAAPKDLLGGEMPGSTWINVKQGDETRGNFLIGRIRSGKTGSTFILMDGDILQTMASL